jgi:hypothetical protein
MKFHRSRLNNRFQWLVGPFSRNSTSHQGEIREDESLLVTDLTNSLSVKEKQLLSKGPKFRIAQQLDEKTIFEMKTNFCRFAYQYKWKTARMQQDLSLNSTED